MPNILSDSLTQGLERILDLRSKQHALTASNLANADTPGFKAKHVDFDHALAEAVGAGDRLQMSRADALHMTAPGGPGDPSIIEMEAAPWSENGNSVYAEREVATMNANSLMYTAVTKGVSRKLALLKFAAGDGR